jgi:hypothetical protein
MDNIKRTRFMVFTVTDLSPADFHLCSRKKSIVYGITVNRWDELCDLIQVAGQQYDICQKFFSMPFILTGEFSALLKTFYKN